MELAALNLDKLSEELPLPMRKHLAEKTSRKFAAGKLTASDRKTAEKIFVLLANDTEVVVRRTLSEYLKFDSSIPHEVAMKLAKDVTEVAVPMLQFSEVFSDDELIEIVQSSEQLSSQIAVASRKTVSEKLGIALVELGALEVAQTLAANDGADITDELTVRAARTFPAENTLMNKLIDRTSMSPALAERLITCVADNVKRTILKKFDISPFRLEDAVQATKEWSTLQMLNTTNHKQVQKLVDYLAAQERLSDSLIIRSLCQGNLHFFEAGMAKRAGIPRANARKLILDPGQMGLRALYKASGMPAGVFEAVSTVLRIALEETHYGKVLRPDYQRRIIERIIIGGYDMEVDNMPFMMAILGRNMPVSASVH